MPWIIGVAFAVWLLVLLGLTLFLVFMEETRPRKTMCIDCLQNQLIEATLRRLTNWKNHWSTTL